jgi:hypothetical protein
VVVILGGCASAKFIATGPAYPARPENCKIEVFISKLPDKEYEELGVIEGEGFFGADTLEEILPKMKQEACKAGGDAIILMSSQKTANVFTDGSDDKLYTTATVIRWAD